MQIIRHQILCVVGHQYMAYSKGKLLVSGDLKHFEKLCVIPMPTKQRMFASFSLSARMFRLYPRAVCVLDENSFIFGFNGRIFNVNISQRSITVEHDFPLPMKTPLAFAKVEGVKGFDDCVIYGEYHANPQKRDMAVYARRNGKWEIVCSFRADQILHIHGFCVDKANGRVLILTGDSDKESAIYEAKNNFAYIKPLLSGSQKFRSCVAFADTNILYATDTPLENNYIYRFDGNGNIEKIFNMPGPSIFGCKIEKGGKIKYVFSTSVEPDSRIKDKRYFFTYKLGNGVKSRYCHIIIGNEKNGFETLTKIKKDWLPMTAFQFGNASFCVGEEKLIVVPQSLKGLNNKSIVFDLSKLI